MSYQDSRRIVCVFLATIFSLSVVYQASAIDSGDGHPDLFDLGIENLMDLEVTSVSKREEKLFEAATAVHVITKEDIRRSGAQSIPEALRLATGMEVARINGNQYAISARGQNEMFSDKLLVLMDGRALYTPTFAGVWWVAQNYPMEEIERIEVIKGPGATLWGSNAVNGVINIITKTAENSQGLLVTAGTSSEENAFTTLRYGVASGDNMFSKFYAMASGRDGGADEDGSDKNDGRELYQAGFKTEWKMDNEGRLTFQGDIYDIDAQAEGAVFTIPGEPLSHYERTNNYFGGNLLMLYTRQLNDFTKLKTQLYYDHTNINTNIFGEKRNTYDAEVQLDTEPLNRHKLSIGAGYRYTEDSVADTVILQMKDDEYSLTNIFAQDEVTLIEERLKLILGVKFEENTYTGWETMPNIRMVWTDELWTLWGAVSRAVRLPYRAEDDVSINLFSGPEEMVVGRVIGDGRGESEKMIAYEAGFRVRPAHNFFIDIALYYDDYDDIMSSYQGTPFPEASPAPPHYVLPVYLDNIYDGETHGLDLTMEWTPAVWLKFSAGYTYTEMNIDVKSEFKSDRTLKSAGWLEGESPRNRFTFRTYTDLPHNVEFDAMLYYKDELPGVGHDVDSYTRLDLRLGWKPVDSFDISVIGMNLLDKEHWEHEDSYFEQRSAIERSVLLKVTYRSR